MARAARLVLDWHPYVNGACRRCGGTARRIDAKGWSLVNVRKVIVIGLLIAGSSKAYGASSVSVRSVRCLDLQDSEGRVIGPVFAVQNNNNDSVMSLEHDGTPFLLTFQSNGVFNDQSGANTLYFESSDCSTPAYMDVDDTYRGPITVTGGTLFFAASGSFSMREVLAVKVANGGCQPITPYARGVWQATPIFDLSIYKPPFSLKVCKGGGA
jgi:hypothetical protein